MTSQRHERLYAIFREACDLQGAARDEFLDRQCQDEADLRREVEGLLVLLGFTPQIRAIVHFLSKRI